MLAGLKGLGGIDRLSWVSCIYPAKGTAAEAKLPRASRRKPRKHPKKDPIHILNRPHKRLFDSDQIQLVWRVSGC